MFVCVCGGHGDEALCVQTINRLKVRAIKEEPVSG